MKYQTLKSYIRRKYNSYLKTHYPDQKKYLRQLLTLSKQNYRLAVICQSYYITHKSIEEANLFSAYTGETYKNLDEFKASNNKYVIQFRDVSKYNHDIKEHYANAVNEIIEEYKLSISKVAKETNMDRSNLYKVLKHNDFDRLSNDKLISLHKQVSQMIKKSTL